MIEQDENGHTRDPNQDEVSMDSAARSHGSGRPKNITTVLFSDTPKQEKGATYIPPGGETSELSQEPVSPQQQIDRTETGKRYTERRVRSPKGVGPGKAKAKAKTSAAPKTVSSKAKRPFDTLKAEAEVNDIEGRRSLYIGLEGKVNLNAADQATKELNVARAVYGAIIEEVGFQKNDQFRVKVNFKEARGIVSDSLAINYWAGKGTNDNVSWDKDGEVITAFCTLTPNSEPDPDNADVKSLTPEERATTYFFEVEIHDRFRQLFNRGEHPYFSVERASASPKSVLSDPDYLEKAGKEEATEARKLRRKEYADTLKAEANLAKQDRDLERDTERKADEAAREGDAK